MTYQPLISGENIKTINGQSILGGGDLSISVGTDYTELLLKFNGANNSTDFVDESKNNYLIVPTGTPIISTSESKFGGSSLYLNGSSSVGYLPIKFISDFTVEFWIKTNGADIGSVFSLMGSTNSPTSVIYLDGSTIGFYFYQYSNPNISTGVINDNQWHHIALCRNKSSFYFYTDGLLSSTLTNEFRPSPFVTDYAKNCLIGDDGAGRYITAYIDNVRISSKAIYTPILFSNGFSLPDENYNVTAL